MPHSSHISETEIFSNPRLFINLFNAAASAFLVMLESAIWFTLSFYRQPVKGLSDRFSSGSHT